MEEMAMDDIEFGTIKIHLKELMDPGKSKYLNQ